MAQYYPPVGFHFKVEFLGIPTQEKDVQFQSVSGLTVNIETEQFAEGGENRFKHTFPVRSKYPNLILKRGMVTDSQLIDWCQESVQNFQFVPSDLIVKLLNEEHEPLAAWNVIHALPVKWEVTELNAEKNKLVVETIELSYNYFTLV